MRMEDPIYAMYVKELLKQIDEKLKQEVEYVTSFVQEDYAQHVGTIKALRDIRDSFIEVTEKFFPAT